MEYIYSMEDKFSDNNFVTRREENNIRYNSKVNFPLNSYVIVENKNNNEIYEVYKSNDGIINKKEKGLFKNNHSVEKGSKYNIYFINKNSIEGNYGNFFNILLDGITLKVYIRLIYKFSVLDPKMFITKCIGTDLYTYPKSYFKNYINKYIGDYLIKLIKEDIEIFGFDKIVVKNKIDIESLNNKLNDFSSICGVNFEISKLTLEEDERIISIKDEINLKRYLINHIKGE